MTRVRYQTYSPITNTQNLQSLSSATDTPSNIRTKRASSMISISSIPAAAAPATDLTLIPPPWPLTDHLSFKERHAKRFLDWQYLSAYAGLGAFGRRALTTALLIAGVGAALSGVGLLAVVIATAALLFIDISYISIFGHKDRYSIERNEIKLYQLQIDHWLKENKNNKDYEKKIKQLTELLAKHRETKERDRLAIQDLAKAKKLKKILGTHSPDIDINEALQAMADRQCPGINKSTVSQAYKLSQIRLQTERNIEACVAELKDLELQLTQQALLLRADRIAQESSRKSLVELSEEIGNKTEELFYQNFTKLNAAEADLLKQNNQDKTKVYDILTHDPLVRRLMAECKINANLLAKEYKQKNITLGHLLGEHFSRMSAVYDNENKRIFSVNRKLTFGQFIKVGFRGLSLSLVLAFIFHSTGLFTFSSGNFLLIGLLGGLGGLILGLGNSFAQRNKDNLNQKYNDDADGYKEKDRRTKIICLMQVLEAKIHYAPTRQAGDRTTPSIAVNHLKRDMLFKLIPIIFLLGSLSRRPLTLLKLLPYSDMFRSLFPITIILVSMVGFLIYDLGLSAGYIHRQRHSLDMHELQNPAIESELVTNNINLILEDKIDTKLQTLARFKEKSSHVTELIRNRMLSPLTTIVGNDKIAAHIIDTLCTPGKTPHELRNALLLGFGPDPKLPEQYCDHHPIREEVLEKLEDLQVMKPTFRGMSVGGSLPNLFTHANLTALTIGSLATGVGLSSFFPIPIPVGLALGLAIGLGLGIWMRNIDNRQEALQKQNIKSPDEFHTTDIRRKLNDALDAILLNDFTPPTTSTLPYTPFASISLAGLMPPRTSTKREYVYVGKHSNALSSNERADFN